MTSTPAAALFGTMASSPMAGGADGAAGANAAKGQGVAGTFAAMLGGQLTGEATGAPMPPPGGLLKGQTIESAQDQAAPTLTLGGLPVAGAEGEAGKGGTGKSDSAKGNPGMGGGLGVSALLAADAMPQAAVPVLSAKFGQATTEQAVTAGLTTAVATEAASSAEGQVQGQVAEGMLPANHGMEVAEQNAHEGLPVTASPKQAGGKPEAATPPVASPASAVEAESLAVAEAAQGNAKAIGNGIGKGLEMKSAKATETAKVVQDVAEGEDAETDAEVQLVQADPQANPVQLAEVPQATHTQHAEVMDAPKGQDVKAAVDASKPSGAAISADLAGKQLAKEDVSVDGTAVAAAAVAEGRGDAGAAQHAGHSRAEGSDFSALITGQGETQRSASVQQTDKAAATAVQHPTISAQPGRIGKELGVEIARYMQDGTDQLTVRLDPGHHGQIEVTMKFDDNGQLRATVTASQSATLEMLRRDSADLMRSLSDAGVNTDAQSFQFDSRGQGSQQGQQQRASGFGRGGNGLNDLGASAAQTDEPHYRPLVGGGRVNMVA